MKDQLANIGVEIDENDLLQTTIDGLTTSWETFLAAVNGREEQPNFEILCMTAFKKKGASRTKQCTLNKRI